MTMEDLERSLVYVGTYAQSEKRSIFLYEMNNGTGELTFIKSFEGGQNPSYMTFDKNYDYVYAVNEIENYAGKNSGTGCAFSVDHQTGNITLMIRVPSLGKLPANITINEDGKVVLIANYKSGSVAIFPVQEMVRWEMHLIWFSMKVLAQTRKDRNRLMSTLSFLVPIATLFLQ